MSLVMVAKDDAAVREGVRSDGSRRIVVDYFGRSSGNDTGSEAFVIELHNRTLGAHFHPVDQFQILFGREGSLYQRHEIPPLMVHYADAYTTYGPLRGEDQPLRFFTLRAKPTTVTAFMPADRELLVYKGKRSMHVDPTEVDSRSTSDAMDVVTTTLIAEDVDGISAGQITAQPGASIVLPDTYDSNGQYLFVANGSIVFNGRDFGTESLGWIGPAESGQVIHAGDQGCECLLTRFPLPETPLVRLGA
jgi:hypothetical protein